MSTVIKTLKLLNYLTTRSPELGLSQFTKLSGYDKASTHRRLVDLVKAGFLEQDPVKKTYRLGAAIPRLALVREQTFPAGESARRVLQRLYEQVHETVHVSVVQGTEGLSTLAHIDDESHGNRVYIEPADILPFHATASGLVVLAHAEPEFRQGVLQTTLAAITRETETDAAALLARLDAIRARGFSRSDGGYETDVSGISAPLFDRKGRCCGAIAVAAPKARVNAETEPAIRASLADAAAALTRDWGGSVPPEVVEAWKATLG